MLSLDLACTTCLAGRVHLIACDLAPGPPRKARSGSLSDPPVNEFVSYGEFRAREG